VEELGAVLQVRVMSELEGRPFVRWLWMRNQSPVLRMRLVGSAPRRRTITCRFPTRLAGDMLTMDVPGGIVSRPAHKLYRPTFWPARSFVHLRGPDGAGLAAFLGGPAAISSDGEGSLEWIALRFAPREMAFRILPLLSHPASGTDPHEGQLDYAVWFTAGGDAWANRLPHHVRRALRAAMFDPHEPDLDDLANSVVVLDRDDVQVTALKPAFRSDGVVVRLASFAKQPAVVTLTCPTRPIQKAVLCNARERPLRELDVRNGRVVVPMPLALASVLVSF
jgi:alpha-mannosidase